MCSDRPVDFAPGAAAADYTQRMRDFLDEEVLPAEAVYDAWRAPLRGTPREWDHPPVVEELKAKARERGLWNLFLPAEHAGRYAADFGTDGGAGLTNSEYAPIAEAMGSSGLAPVIFNCNAPDTLSLIHI